MPDIESRLTAAQHRSSYVESVLRHSLIGELGSELWKRSAEATLQVFNSEVDDAGFDLVLKVGSAIRYVQLKQAHNGKKPQHCSIRLAFSELPGSCVILIAYSIKSLSISGYRFFGRDADEPMDSIDTHKPSKSTVKKNIGGKKQIRQNYRDVPVTRFSKSLSASELVDRLFPATSAQQQDGVDPLLALIGTWPSNGETADEYVENLRK